jgi:uncharacterized membrane protein (DUF2068 family)
MMEKKSRSLGVFVIGIFKLTKAILFVALGIGMLKLINKDVDDLFQDLIQKLHISEQHRIIQDIMVKLSLVTNHTLEEASGVSFFFALLLFVEAFGLLWQKTWAEFVTVIETSIFIPFEIYEMIHHMTLTKVILFMINIIIVAYLIRTIMQKTRSRRLIRFAQKQGVSSE